MHWTIVPYTFQHTPDLRRIYLGARRAAFHWLPPNTFHLADFDAATAGEELLVAVQQQLPIGFIAWWPPGNFIHSLFIDPQFTRRGVGRALLQAGLAQLGRPAALKCLRANKEALRFYEAQGWIIGGTGDSVDGPYYLLVWAQD